MTAPRAGTISRRARRHGVAEAGVFFTILHRTILWELVRVFLMSLLGITGILLIAGIVAEASQHGLSPGQLFLVIPLLIPSTLPYTIPATTLFATCMVYGRLAHDNEILAIKSAGVNIMRVVWPGAFLGIVMTVVTATLYFQVIPNTHYLLRTMFLSEVEEFLYTLLKKDGFIKHPKLNYELYVRRVQGKKLIDAEFKVLDAKTRLATVTARASEAELRVEPQRGVIHVHMHRCYFASSETNPVQSYVADKVWDVEMPNDLNSSRKFRAADMTWDEMVDRREELTDEIDQEKAKIALLQGKYRMPPDDMSKHIDNLQWVIKSKQMELLNLDVEMQLRPALGLGCLCFVLIGCPVGIWFSKSDYLSAFITCFLPIVFLYYPLLLCGISLAKTGLANPIVCLWSANAIMLLIALGLFRKLLRN
jgi:lipopolysaccharide export system permease protein